MSRFMDYYSDGEVKDIMEKFIERFPGMFEGFDVKHIGFVATKKKKSFKPIKLRTVSYPLEVFVCKPYIVETFDAQWVKLDQKKKNLAVFHIMCAIPDGGFDPNSKHYGKKVKPEIEMYLREYAAAGGIPNWLENPAAVDPMERTEDEMAKDLPGGLEAIPEEDGDDGKVVRVPVTHKTIASVGTKGGKKAALAAAS